MRSNRGTIVRADLDVDPEHASTGDARIERCAAIDSIAEIEQREHRRTQDERTTVRDTGLDDEIRPHPPDQLLSSDDILWVLNNRTAHPAEVVGIFRHRRRAHDPRGRLTKLRVRSVRSDPLFDFRLEG